MADRPFIIFPPPRDVSAADRGNARPRSYEYQYPTHDRQADRLTPKFEVLQAAFEQKRYEFRTSLTGILPEQVLVLETVGTVENFRNTVRSTPGMEWLGEWDEDDIAQDEDFRKPDASPDTPLRGKLFLVMTRQSAMERLVSLWNLWKRDRNALGHGFGRFRQIFDQLHDIRFWDVQDRIGDTGIWEDWQDRVNRGEELARFEAELWVTNEANTRQAQERFAELLAQSNGRMIQETIIQEIAYHGILAEMPITNIEQIINHEDVRLLKCDQVMFFRPVGQAVAPIPVDEPLPGPPQRPPSTPINNSPVVALLDGMPLENHALLQDRLQVDDPDDWTDDYEARDRSHGTAMASLILHGELDAEEAALNRAIYVRPILKPRLRDFNGRTWEAVPEDALPIDLIHRAVRRIFEGEGDLPAAAPSVRIINFAVGDRTQQFRRFMSSWARLLDWLSWKYQVLILVSAGNHTDNIETNLPADPTQPLTHEQLQAATLQAMETDAHNRRLLSPAEAINVVTVGAVHDDASEITRMADRLDLVSPGLPSPITSIGLGFRRAIKPEILMSGGRQLYEESINNGTSRTFRCREVTRIAPGQRVASPGMGQGDLNATRYACGTSNSTALATRTTAQIYELLQELRQEHGGEILEDRFMASLLKALLVHGAGWGETYQILRAVLLTPSNANRFKEHASRFLGYGEVDISRILGCTDQRATMIGCGELSSDGAHLYLVQLPQCLSGPKLWRRLTITLAWLTPINPFNRKYRCAALWFEPPTKPLMIGRQEANWQAVRRGTVQHEILVGNNATAFTEGDMLRIQVNCRADACENIEDIPYSLVVTLEVAEGESIPIYEEVYAGTRAAVPITPEFNNGGNTY